MRKSARRRSSIWRILSLASSEQQTMEKSTSPVRYQFIINLSIPFTSPQWKAKSPNTNRGRTFISSYTWEAGRVALKERVTYTFLRTGCLDWNSVTSVQDWFFLSFSPIHLTRDKSEQRSLHGYNVSLIFPTGDWRGLAVQHLLCSSQIHGVPPVRPHVVQVSTKNNLLQYVL